MTSLYILSGLPAVGKSTIARALAKSTDAAWIRVDTIEQALRREGMSSTEVGPKGYFIAYDLSRDILLNGTSVVADSVNSISLTRKSWQQVATKSGARCVRIELYCSDTKEHRRRAESRSPEIQGHVLPTWADIQQREFAPWKDVDVRIDTSVVSVSEAVNLIMQLA